MLVDKEIDDPVVDAVQETLLHLDGSQRAVLKSLFVTDRKIVPNAGGVRRVIGVDDDFSMTDDQQAVLLVATDKADEPRECGRVHPLRLGR